MKKIFYSISGILILNSCSSPQPGKTEGEIKSTYNYDSAESAKKITEMNAANAAANINTHIFTKEEKFGLNEDQRYFINKHFIEMSDRLQRVVDVSYPMKTELTPEVQQKSTTEKGEYIAKINKDRDDFEQKLFKEENKKFLKENKITQQVLDSIRAEATAKHWWN